MTSTAITLGQARWTRAQRRGRGFVWLCAAIGFLAVLASVGLGAADAGVGDLATWLGVQLHLFDRAVLSPTTDLVLQIRLPRSLAAASVGASLGLSGAVVQGLFRNPLADPGLLGVSAGAALGAVATIVLGGGLIAWLPGLAGQLVLPLAAFAGGLIATGLVCRIAALRPDLGIAAILLAGIAINAVAMAGIGGFVFVSDDSQLRSLNFWMLGSVASSTWTTTLPAVAMMALPLILLPRLTRSLNLLAVGERESAHLGVDVERLKRRSIVLVAMCVGAGVAISGMIGFVGLVVPHLVRLAVGPDHRLVLPCSALLGAALLSGADVIARLVIVPAELPIGLVTSAVGGPFFIWLLVRRRRGAGV